MRIVVETVVPKITQTVPILLKGKLIYDGEEEYLPRTIGVFNTRHDGLTIRYEYEDAYERYGAHSRSQIEEDPFFKNDRFRSLL